MAQKTQQIIPLSDANLPETRDFWKRGEAGRAYDQEFKSLTGWYVNESEIRPVRDLVEDFHGKRVLDVGCGTGRYLGLYPGDNQMVGADLSTAMMVEARQKKPSAFFVSASADQLPFPDSSFDVVMSVRVLQHLRDQQAMVSEMARVTKPGGRVILISYNGWSLLGLYKQIRLSWVGRVLNIPFKFILGRRSFFNPWGFKYDNYCSLPELSGMMRRAGLQVRTGWGLTCGMPWFLNDFFIGKILERLARPLFHAFLKGLLFLDRTIARVFPLKYVTDKILVVGFKPE